MILVDSNVAMDALDPDSEFHDWAVGALGDALEQGAFLNHVVVAELSVRAESLDRLAEMVDILGLPVQPLDLDTSFRAGQAFARWIDNGGRRGAMLPDFLIGAQAQAIGAAILTRDVRRFRSYFRDLDLITPDDRDD